MSDKSEDQRAAENARYVRDLSTLDEAHAQGALSSTALAALEKLCEAATGDVWSSGNDSARMGTSPDGRYDIFVSGDYLLFPDKGPGPVAIAAGKNNADAIVALFNAFPPLAATIRASEARIGELEGNVQFWIESSQLHATEWDKARAQRDAALAEVERLKGALHQIWDAGNDVFFNAPGKPFRDAMDAVEKALGYSTRVRLDRTQNTVDFALQIETINNNLQASDASEVAFRGKPVSAPRSDRRSDPEDGSVDASGRPACEPSQSGLEGNADPQAKITRPSTPAPDRGVPGRDGFTEDEFVELRNALLTASSETHLKAMLCDNLNVILAALGRRTVMGLHQASNAGPPDARQSPFEIYDAASQIATAVCNNKLLVDMCWLKARTDFPKADKWALNEEGTNYLAHIHGAVQEAVSNARATHPTPPEWWDAMEAAAKVAEEWAPQHELNTALARAIGGNIAKAIRALPPPSTSASPWRDKIEKLAEQVSAEIGKRFGQDIGRVVLWQIRGHAGAAPTPPATEAENGR